MFKLIEYDRFRPDGLEVIFPIDLDRPLRKQAAASAHVKIAEPLAKFCSSIEPHPDRRYFINVALGAGETWGCNKNGDTFPRAELAVENEKYGYTTFLKAGRYKHHNNRDPEKSLGKVVYAYWNPRMDRVELVSWIDIHKAPDIADRIDNLEKTGEDIGTSMGTRVPYDICSVCHHKSASIKNYCLHLKTAMGRILPGGKAVYAHNVKPFFFDDSFVILKAASEAGVTMKVASANGLIVPSAALGLEVYGEDVAERAGDKKADDKKGAIKKEIPGQVEMITPEDQERIDSSRQLMKDLSAVIEGNQEPLPNEKLSALASFPIENVLATSAYMGMVLTPTEFQKVALASKGRVGALVAHALEADGLVFDPESPEVIDWEEKLAATDVQPFRLEDVSDKVAAILLPMAPARSYWEPHASERFEKWAGWGVARRIDRAVACKVASLEKRGDLSLLLPLALGYALYRMQLGKQAPGMIDRFITSRPAIALPLLSGLAVGGVTVLEPPPGMTQPLPRANEKMAGIGTRFVLPFFAPYVYSAELKREEINRGYPQSGFKGFAKEHPGVLGLLAVGAAGTLVAKYKAVAAASKALAKRVGKVFEGSAAASALPKVASAAGETSGQSAKSAVGGAAKLVASGLYKARHFPGALIDEVLLQRLARALGG
jgi:hypothetical protein